MRLTNRFCFFTAAAFVATLGCDAAPIVINSNDRQAVVAGFHEYYLGTEDYADHVGWTGSLSGCNPGTLSAEFHADVETRINYFRAMAGVVADIELSPELNAAAQHGALMMARNGMLSHNPPAAWYCYNATGAQAAENGNLSIGFNSGNYGPEAVKSQMQDTGGNNIEVGHRRWLLYSRAPQFFGNGSIPPTPSISNPGTTVASSVFWVIGDERTPAVTPSQISWPPAGFVPSPVVFERWSFALPDQANFSTANVTMTDSAGAPVRLSVIHRHNAAYTVGDSSIVWEPEIDLGALTGDTTFTVNVTGITGASVGSTNYQVTIIDPYTVTPLALSGSTTPYLNHDNSYSFVPASEAEGYDFRSAQLSSTSWTEGGETSTPVIDGTSADLTLRTTALKRSGSYSLHLGVNAGDQDQNFEIGRDIIPTAASTLTFYQRFRYVGEGMRLVAEILPAGGGWTEIWSRTGTCGGSCGSGNWDSNWISASVSLSSYAGQLVSLRFRYVYESSYQWWPNPGEDETIYGAFIDDISVSNSQQLTNITTTSIAAGATTLTFNTSTEGNYLLQLRPIIAGNPFPYGDPLAVYASGIAPELTELPFIGSVSLDATGAYCITTSLIDAATAASMQVQSSVDLTTGNWQNTVFNVSANPDGTTSTICVSPSVGVSRQYFRIVLP